MRTIEELKTFFQERLYPDLEVLDKERKEVMETVLIYEGVAAVLLAVALFFFVQILGFRRIDVLLVLGFLAMTGLFYLATKQYCSRFKDVVIEPLVKFFDESLIYKKTSYIAQSIYAQSKLFPHHVERYRGDDYVSGTLDKTQLEFSELHTEYSVQTKNGRRWVTIFKGLFFVADFNKNFKGRTIVLPDSAEKTFGAFGSFLQSKNTSRGTLVKMDDPVFEKEFVVYGTDSIEAHYILSSSLMSRIVDFQKKTKKPIHLAFVGSKVFVAISYGKNLFEAKIFKTLLDFSPIEEYFNDLKIAIDIVEDLNLNIRIWTKE